MVFLIQPRDPLIVRDGRPFSSFPGAKVRGYAFPPPQVVAGAVRGLVGLGCGFKPGEADKNRWEDLLSRVCLEGPLLYDFLREEVFYPAPLDALLMGLGSESSGYELYRLRPEQLRKGELTNLPEGLEPVFAPEDAPKGKPASMPAFWKEEQFMKWLVDELQGPIFVESPADLGIEGLPRDYRTHVKIDSQSQTAEESMLFETSGLAFVYAETRREREGSVRGERAQLSGLRELSLLIRVRGEPPEGCGQKMDALLGGVHPMGGERRLALWKVANEDVWPAEPPEGLVEKVVEDRRARLVLLTPADFNANGNKEPYLPPGKHFGGAKVRAAAVGRPLTVSGWDMLAKKPKPSRRLAPAGSVYFVDLSGVDDIEAWVRDRWMRVLPEQPNQQSRCDGYGLAVVGVWR